MGAGRAVHGECESPRADARRQKVVYYPQSGKKFECACLNRDGARVRRGAVILINQPTGNAPTQEFNAKG